MARTFQEIFEELFKGSDAAIGKYARVRHTLYEMKLWRSYNLPLQEVGKEERRYFAQRFLGGGRIATADQATLDKAFNALQHAVDDGCHGRCLRLVEELNEALSAAGLPKLQQPEAFLDWLTFDYDTIKDDAGNPTKEPGYSFEIRVFHDAENRREFWAETQALLKHKRMLPLTDIYKIVSLKRKAISIE